MRVMVTGASGFVGSYTVAALLAAGHRPRALVRDPGKAAKVLSNLGVAADAVELVPGDMLDPGAVGQALDGCAAAVHTAAAIGVTGAAGDLVTINTTGTRNVVGGAVARGMDPVVYISSISVFVPPDAPVITAESPLASPRTDYSRSKVAAEQYVRSLQNEGAPVTILYPGGVGGPEQPVVGELNEGIVAGLTKIWTCPGSGGVSLIDVRDLAAAITGCTAPGQGPRRWPIGGRFLTWNELVDACDAVTGRRARRVAFPGVLLRALGGTLDLAKRIRPFEFPLTRDAAQLMTTLVPTDDHEVMDALGLTLRPAEETLADSIRWLAAEGHLDPARAGRLAP